MAWCEKHQKARRSCEDCESESEIAALTAERDTLASKLAAAEARIKALEEIEKAAARYVEQRETPINPSGEPVYVERAYDLLVAALLAVLDGDKTGGGS